MIFCKPENAPLTMNRMWRVLTVSFSVPPEMPIPDLCQFLVRGRIHRALVVEDGQLLGIVTSHDVLRGLADKTISA